MSRLRSTRTDDVERVISQPRSQIRRIKHHPPTPFASSEVEMPRGSAQPINVSTTLDTNGSGTGAGVGDSPQRRDRQQRRDTRPIG
ncbi:hypothetical protein EUU25_01905 [Sphingorhabdus lacus]|uniref:Uncharacterized protein n=1 Tax=Sphingorhabdus lacus TaxID=392610 RepID=A0A6I6L1W5_9SPHN|nr:hypothetical protein EUU25_01905 [Sphingorhabdus lacus]